jgi:hypothetical protein
MLEGLKKKLLDVRKELTVRQAPEIKPDGKPMPAARKPSKAFEGVTDETLRFMKTELLAEIKAKTEATEEDQRGLMFEILELNSLKFR